MDWDQVVQKVSSHIVKIGTPYGHGTGFLFLYNEDKTWCGVATAAHVVSNADEWQQPIRIYHQESTAFLSVTDRVIILDLNTDSAVVLFPIDKLQLPENPISLSPVGASLNIGIEVGWLGFPAIAPSLCFFAGNISARQEHRNAYLIDGVAINGVSGGPVLITSQAEGIQIVGIVTAYQANRATGEALPGLSIAQDVSHFHAVANHVRSVDEGVRKKKEFEASQKSSTATGMTEGFPNN
ncbi:MAG: trypsin-like peptidase domain-containing protein [Nitrospirae bacterium]|nr:trypsin-like peptidase domain-containing protein [Nitrospirota bacterium]